MVLVAASQPARGRAVVLVVQSELFQSFFLHSSRLGGGGGGGAGCAAHRPCSFCFIFFSCSHGLGWLGCSGVAGGFFL